MSSYVFSVVSKKKSTCSNPLGNSYHAKPKNSHIALVQLPNTLFCVAILSHLAFGMLLIVQNNLQLHTYTHKTHNNKKSPHTMHRDWGWIILRYVDSNTSTDCVDQCCQLEGHHVFHEPDTAKLATISRPLSHVCDFAFTRHRHTKPHTNRSTSDVFVRFRLFPYA